MHFNCKLIRDSIEKLENSVPSNHVRRERKETIEQLNIPYLPITFGVKSRNSKQQIHRKHFLLKNKDYKHVNGGSSEYTVILSVMYHSNVSGRSSELRALLIAGFIRRISDCVEQLEISVPRSHILRERKETIEQLKILYLPITFSVKSRNSKQQIHRKHFLLKNKDNKHVKSRNSKQQIHRKHFLLKNRRVFIRQISDCVEQLEISVPRSHILRERKETIEQLKILYLPITFSVSEKRLLGQMLDEMRSDTPPG
ncbi:hypothetical protein T03_17667 [Trichinella britovi]|uniref:Uncharacterized protein n=1 Tax=Trichinella britovi TaxID=45882 RepID=A0A0V1C6H2_TRIBR|nr:hypothetical protein T03_17667 [Trichinella britovi]